MPWPWLPGGTEAAIERGWGFRTRELPLGILIAAVLVLMSAAQGLDARVAIPVVAAVVVLGWRGAAALPVARRWPRASALGDTVLILAGSVAPAAASLESENLLWIAFIGVSQALSFLHGPSIATALLVPALPLAIGAGWWLLGLHGPFDQAPGLVLVAVAATTTYLFLSRNYKLTVDYRDRMREQSRRAAADEERRRIRGQVHADLERALDEIERLEERAAAGAAYERVRGALNELRAAVNGLRGETIDALALEGLARRRLLAACERHGARLQLVFTVAGEPPVARAYHLLKLLDALAAGLLRAGAGAFAVRLDWSDAPRLEVAAEPVDAAAVERVAEGLPRAHLDGLGVAARAEAGRLVVEPELPAAAGFDAACAAEAGR